MLNNASGFRKVYIAAGYTDLRRGIDGLASIVKFNFQLDPYEKDILFLFCGRRSDRICKQPLSAASRAAFPGQSRPY